MTQWRNWKAFWGSSLKMSYQIMVTLIFCSTSLPLTSSRSVRLTPKLFLHCPLSLKQWCCLSKISAKSNLKKLWKAENQTRDGWVGARALPQCYAVPPFLPLICYKRDFFSCAWYSLQARSNIIVSCYNSYWSVSLVTNYDRSMFKLKTAELNVQSTNCCNKSSVKEPEAMIPSCCCHFYAGI